MKSGRATWPERWRGYKARDLGLALFMTALTVGGAYGEAYPRQPTDMVVSGHPVPHTPAVAFVLVFLAGVVLVERRRSPVPVLVVSTASVSAFSLLGYVNGAALLAPAVALYALAAAVSIRRALAWGAATLVVLMAATAAGNPFGTTGGGFDLIPALVVAAVLGGIAVSNRQAYAESIRARVEDEARRRVDDERLRIARELHDVVAHTMATINVQASVAIHVLEDRPEAAANALLAIKGASKEGLRELRAILDILRQVDQADPTEPAPGLAQVGELVTNAIAAGLTTTLKVKGEAVPLPPAVDLTAYRIVQESLTNAIRHAGPATATVTLTYDGGELHIEVLDTGSAGALPGRPALEGLGAGAAGSLGGGGHGLIGMRERALSVGGDVQAGPVRPGGFCVLARLPIEGQGPGVPAGPSGQLAST